jgi:predicted Zn-dependent protease
MSDLSAFLEVLGSPAHLEIVEEHQELLRFAESSITYQHSENRVVVRARLIRDGRAAWATATSLDRDKLHELRQRLESSLALLPPGGELDLAAPDGMISPSITFFDSTDRATAQDRANLLREALKTFPANVTLGGSISHTSVTHQVANTRGLCRSQRRTRAGLQLIATGKHGSSFGRVLHRDAAQLPIQQVFQDVHSGLNGRQKRGLEPGTYRAVLGSQATITLLAIYAQIALGGHQYRDGTSAVSGRLGQPVTSPAITLTDDGTDPAGLPTAFDCQGIPKQRVDLIEHGVLAGVVENATGHTTPPAWRFGADPIPSHLFLAPGAATDAELASACQSGLQIQRVDYVRVLNARQTLITGSTRDAVQWIEAGQVVAHLPQFRFTLRLSDLLNGVEAVGQARQRGDTVFMESVVAPSILVSELPVQTVVGSF